MEAAEGTRVEPSPDFDRAHVPRAAVLLSARPQEGWRLSENVVRGEDEVGELSATLTLEDLFHTEVIGVVRVDERVEEACVEEDQPRGSRLGSLGLKTPFS